MAAPRGSGAAGYRPPVSSPPRPGPLLALDVGERRIGLAASDPTRRFVFADGALQRKGVKTDVAALAARCRERGVVGVVVGLPLDLQGREGRTTRLARQVGEALAAATGLPVHWADEQYTSLEAEARLGELGAEDRRRGRVDAGAAVVILEDWLAAHR